MSYFSISFPGTAEYVREVRKWTAKALGDVAGADTVVLVASELATNAIRHSASGNPGGEFSLHLATFANHWQVRVDDAGGLNEPRPREVECAVDEAGRGLAMIAELSSVWGVLGNHYARAVWAEIPIPERKMA